MQDKYIVLKIESVVNKILYNKNVIDKNLYEKTQEQIDRSISQQSS